MKLVRRFDTGYFLKDNEIEKYRGRSLDFDDLEKFEKGQQFIRDCCSTVSHEWYQIVEFVKVYHGDTQYEGYPRRLIYSNNKTFRAGDLCSCNEYWLYNGTYRTAYYELNKGGAIKNGESGKKEGGERTRLLKVRGKDIRGTRLPHGFTLSKKAD